MPPHEETTGTLYICTEDGKAFKPFEYITALPNLDYQYDSAQQAVQAIDCSGEISFTAKIMKGAADIMFGKPWTSAAQRYIRQQIRKKEKTRRMKLKGVAPHEHYKAW